MLKKILFISILTIILLISISWLATTGYISYQTEKQLSNPNPQTILKNLYVINYQKGLNHSQIRFKFNAQTGHKSLNQALHAIIFNAKIKHGPIFYTDKGIQFAHSYWQVSAEQHSLPKNKQHILKKLFADNPLFKLNITFNFHQQGHYQLGIPQIILSEFEQRLGTVASSHFAGMIDLAQQTINLEGKLGEINIKNNNGHLHIPTTEVYADSNNDVALNTKRKANLRTEKVTYKSSKLSNNISFHLNLHIQQQFNEKNKNSSFSLTIDDAKTPKQMIEAVNVKLAYKEQMQTSQQAPALLNTKSLMHTLLQQLEQNQGALDFSFNIIGKQGQINLQAQAETHQVKQAHQLKAQLSLNADKQYIDSTPFTALLAPYIKRNVLLVNNEKYQFNAAINGAQATLNGLELLDDTSTQQRTSSLQKTGF